MLGGIGVFFEWVGKVGIGKFGTATADVDGGEITDSGRHGLSDETIHQADKLFRLDKLSVIEWGKGSNDTLNCYGKVGVVLLGDVGGEDVNIWGNWYDE
jgi:hypothetical protein